MKNFSHSINVNNNSNYIINHTECDWSSIRKDSLISIDDDMHFYTIGRVEPLNLITDFAAIDRNTIALNGNLEENFIRDDIMTISYKEYELLSITSIAAAGSGYRQGEILTIQDGNVSVNTFDNTKNYTVLKVEEIDGNGGILRLSISDKGKYITAPNSTISLDGVGRGARVSVIYSLTVDRKMIEIQLLSCSYDNGRTTLELNSNLPNGVADGKISIYKFKAMLTSNYIGGTKRDTKYHIVRDFTPFIGLPLLSKNSNKNEEFFNYALIQLDNKLKYLQEQINELKNK